MADEPRRRRPRRTRSRRRRARGSPGSAATSLDVSPA